ncbi:ABC-2 type transporter [Desulfitobacterium hafniense DCB-2]|uniref:ABC-2 type transporter n=1 Tax=Desulfitobacterium hafniense (strain DSM 10664 / DCB-2) TaxID=272564 RepID=B8G2I6_DESHD|nr:ABC transporter permease [Desulfitobacterium hafniense]ACL21336.1 ABC-2 type transporter [Desulfitobacterium hafniense DCB-2]
MKELIQVLGAEMKKSHRLNFHSSLIYFSLLVWPAITYVSAYYSFKPFDLGEYSPLNRFLSAENIGLFLLTGYLGYIFFWSLVQSAWQMSFERYAGTIELIFLSPVSRLGVIYGRAAADLLAGVWLFSTFAFLAAVLVGGVQIAGWWSVPLGLLVLAVSAVIWGGFLNVIFLFSRDSGFLYTILDEPMLIFSGVRIPVAALPCWGKLIALVFPLTYVLAILRDLVIEGYGFTQILPSLGVLLAVLAVLFLFSSRLVILAEKHALKTGNLNLF